MSINLPRFLRHYIWWRRFAFAFLPVLLMAAPLGAQTVVGRLQVQVTDSSGALIPGAMVSVTSTDPVRMVTQITGPDGIAMFSNLEPGRYTVQVELPGFSIDRKEVQILVGQTSIVPVKLQLRDVTTQTVTVSAEEERQEQISALPNLNNDLSPLLQVVPGAIAVNSAALGRIVIDGKGKDQQTIRIDGVDATTLAEIPSTDTSIDVLSSFQKAEVALNAEKSAPKSRAFDPAFGPGTGTVTEGITFGRVDSWRAQGYSDHRNDLLNARNFFDYDGKNALRRSRFGGKAGGPLKTNRAFLFVAYEGFRGRIERNLYEAVPIAGSDGGSIGAPASLWGAYVPSGTAIVPGASLNPDFEVARRRARSDVDANAWNTRIDLLASDAAQLTFRFTRQEARNLVPDGVTGRLQRQRILFNNGLADLLLKTPGATHDMRFGFNETSGSIAVNGIATIQPDLSQSLITTGGTVSTTGLPGSPPTVPVATLGGLVKGVGRGFDLKPISTGVSYNYARDGGKHVPFFGVEAKFIRMRFDRLGGLTYAFPNAAALRAGTPASVTYLSDLSAPSPFQNTTGPRHARQQYYMGYFQLLTKATPNLSMTYGVRYDYFGGVRERDGRAVVVDPRTAEILPPGTRFYNATTRNLQPRFSVAYLFPNGGLLRNTTLRAGAGVYSVAGRIGDLVPPIESDRFNTGVTGGTFPMAESDIVRTFVDNPDTRQFQPLAYSRDFVSSERSYKWEASFTKTLKEAYDFKLLYTGNAGRNLPVAGVANQIVLVQTNPDPTKPAVVVRQFDIIRGNQVSKPFGEFFYRSSDGSSSYNGFTVQLKKTKSAESLPNWLNPADFNVQYTLARNVGNVSGAVVSNPLDLNSDYGYNAADARHNFTLSSVYELWNALPMKPPRNSLLWGWRLGPSVTVRSGLPLIARLDRPDVVYQDASGVTFATPAADRSAVLNVPGGGASGATRVPDLLPGVNPYLNNGIELLNPQAFAIPSPGVLGNLRRGQLRGPGSHQLDLSLTRYFFETDQSAVELRVDFFNLFNHANFVNPTVSLPNALGTADNQLQPGMSFSRPVAGGFGIVSAADPGRQIQFSLILRLNGGFTK